MLSGSGLWSSLPTVRLSAQHRLQIKGWPAARYDSPSVVLGRLRTSHASWEMRRTSRARRLASSRSPDVGRVTSRVVTALTLTGERTLPGIATENYWFRRHEVAYAWLAPWCTGARVVDAGCGE